MGYGEPSPCGSSLGSLPRGADAGAFANHEVSVWRSYSFLGFSSLEPTERDFMGRVVPAMWAGSGPADSTVHPGPDPVGALQLLEWPGKGVAIQ